MRIGVSLPDPSGPDAQGRPPLDQVRDALRRAADDGFASAWMNNIFGLDALTTLAVAGSQVPGIELGTAVVPTYPRHPAALAQQALTVAAATDGRLALGVGTSHEVVVANMFGYDFGKPVERVDRAGVHGSSRADKQRRRQAGGAVGRYRAAQCVRVETPARQRHRPDRVAPEPEQLERARHTTVRLRRHVRNQTRAARKPTPAHVVPRRGARAAASAGQAHDRRRRRPAGQQPTARRVRVPNQLRQPAHCRALEMNVGVITRHHARVHRRSSQRRQHTSQCRGRVDPAKERRMPVAHRMRQHVSRHQPRQLLKTDRPVRQR